jgi:hypothetical protein
VFPEILKILAKPRVFTYKFLTFKSLILNKLTNLNILIMRNLKFYTFYLVMFALIFTSCSREEDGLASSEDEKATISFGAMLDDLNINRNSLKQAIGDIPACSEDAVVYVEIILSSGGVDVVGAEGTPFRIDLVAGQLFTKEVTELELDPGNYSLDYFTVHSMDGTVIWVAP